MDIGNWIRGHLPLLNKAVINPVMLSFAGRPFFPVAIVLHVGRRSGAIYTTPVLAEPYGNGFLIALPYGRDTDWCLNVRAARGGFILYRGAAYRVCDPHILSGDRCARELLRGFPLWAEALFAAVHTRDFLYVARTDGDAPVVYRQVTAAHPTGYGVLCIAGVALASGVFLRRARRRWARLSLAK